MPAKKTLLLATMMMGMLYQVHAQQYSSLWQPVKGPVASKGEQLLHPSKYTTFRAAEQTLSSLLTGVSEDIEAASIIELPTPDGNFRSFRVWKTPAMAPELAAKYPGIETFTATAVNDNSVTAKIDYTPFGFHAMIYDGQNTFYIDPYSDVADGNYISFYKKDYPRPANKEIHCDITDEQDAALGMHKETLSSSGLPELAYKMHGTIKRKFRLAVACTRPYAVAVNGGSPTKAGVLARMVTSVNRVNGVYEREMAYTMELVGNNDTLINISAATDPYTNSNGNVMLNQNQVALDQRIGNGAYDIGHVFSTGGGGIATKACVCRNSAKAQGVTGSSTPYGDPYDIDYVAHEMGHQFGADHTFNYNLSSFCATNAVRAQAYEPGSGSTIMAYAGICGTGIDYIAASTFYFHSASMEQMATYIESTSCAVATTSPNNNATLPAFNATYNIPALTPFELIGPNATDNNADSMKYSWEERDLGDFGQTIANTSAGGPLFRPFPPVTSTTRIFPQIDSILRNRFSYVGEKLPEVNRKLAFRLLQRDIYQGFGCWNFPTDSIRLNVTNTGAAFKVTSPASGTVWQANASHVVTWDVSGTTNAPISCANVDILLSTDGGYNFPYTLVTGTPNDGSQSVTIPNVNSTRMRVKVKGAGNVFFSISGANATVQGGTNVSQVTAPEVIISPVPATSTVHIQLNNTRTALNARIINTVGQAVWQGNILEQTDIPVSGWAKGIYYLQLSSESGHINMNKTLIVQ